VDWIQDQASFVHRQSEMRRCSQSKELSASSGTDSFLYFSSFKQMCGIKTWHPDNIKILPTIVRFFVTHVNNQTAQYRLFMRIFEINEKMIKLFWECDGSASDHSPNCVTYYPGFKSATQGTFSSLRAETIENGHKSHQE
jgi:hypothetical protein